MDWSTFMGWGISPLRPGIARTQNLAVILSEVAAPRAAHESKDLHWLLPLLIAASPSRDMGCPRSLALGDRGTREPASAPRPVSGLGFSRAANRPTIFEKLSTRRSRAQMPFVLYQGVSSLTPQPAHPFFKKPSTRRSRARTLDHQGSIPALSAVSAVLPSTQTVSTEKNKLYYGDNFEVLQRYVKDESVDLVYLDPPFNSRQDYNVLFAEKDGSQSSSQIHAFEDTWEWNTDAMRAYEQIVEQGGRVADTMRAFKTFLFNTDMMAYLAMMAPRLVELRRVLKQTGSIYLHCDPTASHYLKILMDAVFGPDHFRTEIIWKRTSSHGNVSASFGDVTDTILYFRRGDRPKWNQVYEPYSEEYIKSHFSQVDSEGRRYTTSDLRNPGVRPNLHYEYRGFKPHPNGWAVSKERMEQYDRENRLVFPTNPDGRIRLKRYLDEQPGEKVTNLWEDIPPINSQA